MKEQMLYPTAKARLHDEIRDYIYYWTESVFHEIRTTPSPFQEGGCPAYFFTVIFVTVLGLPSASIAVILRSVDFVCFSISNETFTSFYCYFIYSQLTCYRYTQFPTTFSASPVPVNDSVSFETVTTVPAAASPGTSVD
ncbi:hypothetical protein KP77_34470 [Jeotgalibacillus alimentarius]|uniref:Uncharacterized protein n=1 Tax=Jeotgalibacillus alimentarius TaxID=135826 RepID=A0A0C2V177_9BACL|nr:hypothetical protein KP77_34470 [Jeotgalibacillus alimentarius]